MKKLLMIIAFCMSFFSAIAQQIARVERIDKVRQMKMAIIISLLAYLIQVLMLLMQSILKWDLRLL